jgi:hypothetical protein
MNKDMLSKALSHILKEIEIPNIVASVEINFREIQKTHDSIHEFIYLAPLCLPKNKSWHEKSAFLTYHFQTFYQAHRSYLEAISGHYNAGYTLLRNVLELLIKGAFWECLAHKKFRDNSGVLEKEDKNYKKLKILLNERINEESGIEKQLEEVSVTIHDMIVDVIENPAYRPYIRTIVKQLEAWDIFNPIPNPGRVVNNIYGELSADVHVIPDKTDIGRRILSQKELFETEVNPDELSNFVKVLHEVIDIGIVIELNILSDWINQDKEVKNRLRERLAVIEDLGLKFSSEKLKRLIEI